MLDDADDEADENPFVDVSERVTSDAAPTTLIPIEETFSAAADAELGDERGATVSLPADQARTTLLPHNGGRYRGAHEKRPRQMLRSPIMWQSRLFRRFCSIRMPGEQHLLMARLWMAYRMPLLRLQPSRRKRLLPARTRPLRHLLVFSRASEEKGEEDAERPLPPASMLRHNPHSADVGFVQQGA